MRVAGRSYSVGSVSVCGDEAAVCERGLYTVEPDCYG